MYRCIYTHSYPFLYFWNHLSPNRLHGLGGSLQFPGFIISGGTEKLTAVVHERRGRSSREMEGIEKNWPVRF